ncbi:UDP-N-acetylmuramoyl-L-alanine--D-glutamate ligase [Microbulbifer flavimaris]|uniref:UDP-N-acetylmuramoylalanine--D-glutamate ligase n=1 Tax=Microbulbifer flavimaris TaxID=1781068 RepID=A0ABX4HZ14_9GAMM|nr:MULTISPECIES: UDP-N-acetylmuramoyl-L-alanine--D-glutamate ligase [Microbulbifer]KUJ83222.1 UDP-N-acetylmuramoylalanine--D-glutamate ligase [Microbulbifer sp. ZGT114]PCO05369.1 UDP-N-acetylmuramoyl-L-alanine--D-glutamate ligase [Microbulbifer flavimaris]
MTLIATSQQKVVIGLGATGVSVVRYLLRAGLVPVVLDSRPQPPGLESFREQFPDVPVQLGPLDAETLLAASEIITSPGVALAEPALQRALAEGIPVVGDIELFAREMNRLEQPPKIAAITGSNGKSTVTTLLGQMAQRAGVRVAVGGNIGVPVLDLLEQALPELFVLELSSFQLETTHSLELTAATILNLSEDHMDRYPDMAAYHAAKQRIYRHAQQLVVNRDDPLTRAPLAQGVKEWSFGLNNPDLGQFGLRQVDGEEWLVRGVEKLMPVAEMAMVGRHNAANALAALALGHAVGLPMDTMLTVLREFPGLTHRCERIGDIGEVIFVNDSKGTNVGATRAALEGLGSSSQKIVLIAGGEGKGADFTPLGEVAGNLRGLVTIGVDGPKIAAALTGACPVKTAGSMEEAVASAMTLAEPGDYVLLSPACASFDMYRNFEARGEDFRRAVTALGASVPAGGAL